jgi:nucleotide-binding universal stress UspA family protein
MKVLVGVGGSDDSIRALRETIDRARAAGDDLTVAVFEGPGAARSRDRVEHRVRDVIDEEGAEADVRLLEGSPGSALVDVAESEGFDEIVLAGGETSPMGKITIGSVVEFVLLNSHVTVKLVR